MIPEPSFRPIDGLLLVYPVAEHDGNHGLNHHESVLLAHSREDIILEGFINEFFHNFVNFFDSKIEYFTEIFAVKVLLRLISLELLKELSKFLAVEVIHLSEYSPSVEEIRLQLVLCVWRFTFRFWLLFENCRLRNFRTLLDFFCYFGNLSNYFMFHLFFRRIFRFL